MRPPREFLREHLGPPTLELAEGLLEAAQRDALGAAGHLDCSGMPELSTSRHVAEWKAVTCHRTPRTEKRGLSPCRDFPNHRKTFVEMRNPTPFNGMILTPIVTGLPTSTPSEKSQHLRQRRILRSIN